MQKKVFTTMALALGISATAFAQSAKTVSGTVCDGSTGEPLIGATVREAGTANATVTDSDGHFLLNVSSNQITVSYVGYETSQVKTAKAGNYDVRLSSDNTINEVVVVGYGTQRKSDLTGSLASVSSKDIKDYATANVSNLIAGKAAGVYVSTASGQPGEDAIVRVRGLGTVNDNSPLYVVDGQFMDNISAVNPADIDRIEVLKDASATAIYGSRGSNGVILITTKGGQSGQTTVSLDASIGWRSSYKALDMMNSHQYYEFITTAYADEASFDKQKFTNQFNKGYDTDWWDEVTRSAFNQNYNLSVRTGTAKSRTALSLGYVDEQGALITTDFNRLNLRLNQEYDINKYVTVGATINIADMRKKDAGALAHFDQSQKADPFTPVINPLVEPGSENYDYNKYAPTEWSWDPNPVSRLRLIDSHHNSFNAFGNLFAQVNLTHDLHYRFQLSFERDNDTYKSFTPVYESVFSADNLANMQSKSNTYTQLTHNTGWVKNYMVENRLNYTHDFGRHHLDVMAAITYEKNDSEGINAYKHTAVGNDEAYRVLDAQTAGDLTSGGRTKTAMMSYLGRVNYAYADRYLATVNFRADGSSRFAKSNRWGYFPSFSLGWRISSEPFFQKSSLASWMDNLKLRAGWGQNGNQRIDAQAPLTLIATDAEKKWWYGNGFTNGYVPSYQGNADIKWETSEQTNIGLDVALLHNTLDMSFDYYIKKTRDMLLQNPVPSFGGYPNSPFVNAGDVRNNGFEFVANYHNHAGDFNYHASLNLSTYKTKVTRLTQDYLTGTVSRTYVGGPMGRFWGYKQIGIFQSQAEIDSYVDADGVKYQPNAHPGDFKFAKLGDGKGAINDEEDRTFIGNPNPDLIYGFSLGFEWKGFDFSAAFQGTLGNDIYNAAKGTLSVPGTQNALADALNKAWKHEGDTGAKWPRITTNNDNNNWRVSSFMVEDGSYLRLQNLQVGYTLPMSLMGKLQYVKSARVYFSAQNLFTITGYSGLDPDLGSASALNLGYDAVRYPSSRTFMFGVNLTF